MRLTIIGASGSFPGPSGPASCYLVEAGGFRLLLDLGNGALGALHHYTDIYDVDAVYLSHLHPDHCMDLCSFWVARRYSPVGPRPAIPVYGPPGVADRMAQAYGMDPDPGMRESFDFLEMAPGSFEIGPLSAHVQRVNHPVEAFGIRLEHEGISLAYSGDTAPCSELVDLSREVDLFLCEASFHDDRENPKDVHLTGVEAGEHASKARVREVLLTHLVPWNDDHLTLQEARSSYQGPVSLARPGGVHEIGAAPVAG